MNRRNLPGKLFNSNFKLRQGKIFYKNCKNSDKRPLPVNIFS